MSSLGGPRDPCQELCRAIEEFEECYAHDPAFKDVCFKLDQVEQELDVLTASPGRRAAQRAAMPNHAGQEPTERSESHSYVQ